MIGLLRGMSFERVKEKEKDIKDDNNKLLQ